MKLLIFTKLTVYDREQMPHKSTVIEVDALAAVGGYDRKVLLHVSGILLTIFRMVGISISPKEIASSSN